MQTHFVFHSHWFLLTWCCIYRTRQDDNWYWLLCYSLLCSITIKWENSLYPPHTFGSHLSIVEGLKTQLNRFIDRNLTCLMHIFTTCFILCTYRFLLNVEKTMQWSVYFKMKEETFFYFNFISELKLVYFLKEINIANNNCYTLYIYIEFDDPFNFNWHVQIGQS